MKSSSVIRYPVPGVTLHRVTLAGQRSQGDGEEQQTPTPDTHTSLESTKTLTHTPTTANTISPPKTLREMTSSSSREEKNTNKRKDKIKEQEKQNHLSVLTIQDGSDVRSKRRNSDNLSDMVKGGSTKGNVRKEPLHTLPEIIEIATKLTKVSIMSSPDPNILNAAPKDLDAKRKVHLLPKPTTFPMALSNTRAQVLGGRSRVKKDPRFVPYEPYKGCVKPILFKKKKRRVSKKRVKVEGEGEKKEQKKEVDNCKDVEKRNAEKLSILVRDFEKERTSWEERVSSLTTEKRNLEEQMSSLRKDRSNLESQLNVQSQVNTELKRLLVASVGEEVQGRVQCLTEDKARMASMIRHYSEKVDRDYEEKERIGIQCDVWRSKFLASSMMVDELVGMRVNLSHKLEEAEEALKVLLAEHDLARQHTLNMYRMNKQLREAFDPLAACSGGVPPLSSADLVTMAVEGDVLAETVRDRLLGELGRSVGCSLPLDGLEIFTPGQRMATQLLHQLEDLRASGNISTSSGGKRQCSTLCPGRSALLHRFHPNARYEHITVNCCAHCNGEIKVV